MEWTGWLTDYYHRHTEEYFRNALKENGLPGDMITEKTIIGEMEYTQYRYVCGEEGILTGGICFEDLKKLCESTEEDVEPEELVNVLCGAWVDEYHFMEENRERLFQKDIAKYLFPVLMNTKLNENLLHEMPHVKKGEYSVALRLGIPVEGEKGMTIHVSNKMLESWGIGLDEAMEMAVHNQWFVEQCTVISDSELVQKMNQQAVKEFGGIFQFVEPEEETGFMIYGRYVPCAAILLNEEFAEEIHKKMGGDFLVAFFGTGEVQICRDEGNIEDLQIDLEVKNELYGFSWNMVSDQIFHYTKERGLEPASGMEKEKQRVGEPALKR